MNSKLLELRRLADEILASLEWREPHQYNSFAHAITDALKAAHTSLNGPCQAHVEHRGRSHVIQVQRYSQDESDGSGAAPVLSDTGMVVPLAAFAVNPGEV